MTHTGARRVAIVVLVLAALATAGTEVAVRLPALRQAFHDSPLQTIRIVKGHDWEAGKGGPEGLLEGDFDGDGLEDVLAVGGVIVRGGHVWSTFYVLPGRRGAAPGPVYRAPILGAADLPAHIRPGGRITSLATGDLDGDGRTDLVIAYRSGAAVFLGGGGAHHRAFTLAGFLEDQGRPLTLARVVVGPVGTNGGPAIVSFDPASRSVRLWQRGEGGVFSASVLATARGSGKIAGDVAIGDVDGDGHADVAAVESSPFTAQALVLHNTGDGRFVRLQTLPLAGPLPAGTLLHGPRLLLAPVIGRGLDLVCVTEVFGLLNARGTTLLNLFVNGRRRPGSPTDLPYDPRERLLSVEAVPGVEAALTIGRLHPDPGLSVVSYNPDGFWSYDHAHRPFAFDIGSGMDFDGALRDAVISRLGEKVPGFVVMLAQGHTPDVPATSAYLLIYRARIFGRLVCRR